MTGSLRAAGSGSPRAGRVVWWTAWAGLALALAIGLDARQDRPTLIGWAMLPAATFSDGPTTGQFAGTGQFGNTLPVVDRQVVQGFSAVLAGPAPGVYYVLTDNGFGAKNNSADALLRVYAVRPDFRTASGGTGTIAPADVRTGARLQGFSPDSFIQLRDPNRRLGFPLVADSPGYPGPGGVPVAPVIKSGRLLTGADLDVESVRVDRDGYWWFGDEFGPFVVKADRFGVVQRAEIGIDGVIAPENPHRGDSPATVGGSRGLEGLAIDPAGARLYGLVEGTVTGDPANTLRIYEFDTRTERFTGRQFRYQLDEAGTNIGDMTAVDDHTMLVLERNGTSGIGGPVTPFKKVFRIDLAAVGPDGVVRKSELVDLMNVADPDDLDRDGTRTFTFPFVTIEDLLVIDRSTLLVINDNNYPGGGARGAASDNTEMILIRLPQPLR